MTTLRLCRLESPLGELLAGAVCRGGEEQVCLLEFHKRRALPTERRDLEARFGCAWQEQSRATGVLAMLTNELEQYFAGELRAFTVPVDAPGTPFRQRVWQELQRIPYGETISYIELARRVGKPGGSRAVGQANGSNRIAIVIPCHRVIAADGTLGGYGGKLWRKELLLNLEQGVALPAASPAALAHV
jgi:AraC family transcriptional regulator, regulatory protein of adaptative response / methylated-DNA-[protein]-cysteine methyltransferase